MAISTNAGSNGTTLVVIVALVVLAFAGGYYYYQHKDKDTVLDVNLGGKNISATVEHQ